MTTITEAPTGVPPAAGPLQASAAAPSPPVADLFAPFPVGEMTRRVADMAIEKSATPWTLLVRSLVAGAMVVFGVLLSLIVSTGVTIPGLASLVMGLAFGMSFVLILVSGMSLVTADVAAGLFAVLQGRLGIGRYVRMLVIGLVGNIAGAFAFIAVAAVAGGPYLGGVAERAAAIGTAKADQSVLTAILLALLCTWFLQTAMCLFFTARTDIARMGFAFYGPFAFVIAGTQHVIANVGFLGLPLLLAAFHGTDPGGVSWGLASDGLVTNIIVTTIGNVVGGTLFVAVPFHVIAELQRRRR